MLLEAGYVSGPDVFDSLHEDQALIYRRLRRSAAAAAVVAYYWPPTADSNGVNVLHNDRAIEWAELDEEGRLMNPRTGKLIASLAPAAGPAPARTFGSVGYGSRELAAAIEMEQQMDAGRAASDGAQVAARRQALRELLLEEHREEVEQAFEQFQEDYDDEIPVTEEALQPYLRDKALREALADVMEERRLMPALTRSRDEARKSNRKGALHNIGLGIQMYLTAHDEQFPPDLQAVVDAGYLEKDVLDAWPELQLRYRTPDDPKAGDVIAYHWPPQNGGTNVVYYDNAVEWVDLDSEGRLINPRTGRVVPMGRIGWAPPEAAEEPLDRRQLAVERYNLGLAWLNRGDYERAEQDFTRAVELDPDYANGARKLVQTRALRRASAAAGQEEAAQAEDLLSLDAELQRKEDRLERIGAKPRAQVGVDAPQVAVAEPGATKLRPGKAVLVRSAGGGRSIGALPIAIEFPMPATADYQFTKPFLGRAVASLTLRTLSRPAARLVELGLAIVALAACLAMRRRGLGRAGALGLTVLVACLAVHWLASAEAASLCGSAVLAVAAWLTFESISLGARRLRAALTRNAGR